MLAVRDLFLKKSIFDFFLILENEEVMWKKKKKRVRLGVFWFFFLFCFVLISKISFHLVYLVYLVFDGRKTIWLTVFAFALSD